MLCVFCPCVVQPNGKLLVLVVRLPAELGGDGVTEFPGKNASVRFKLLKLFWSWGFVISIGRPFINSDGTILFLAVFPFHAVLSRPSGDSVAQLLLFKKSKKL